jgi:hypothetical protein
MKHATLIAAAGVIALSNAFALLHAAWNRSGAPEAEVTLSDRDLSYYANDEDSGVELEMRWTDPNNTLAYDDEAPRTLRWLDAVKLREIGFDTAASSADDEWYERRQMPRTAFVALELDGPTWQAWAEYRRFCAREHPTQRTTMPSVEQELESASRWVCFDADSDASALGSRHPDRSGVLVLPCVVGIERHFGLAATQHHDAKPAFLIGSIREIPSSIHVPLPFSAEIRAAAHFSVRMRYGRSLEPWVIGVEVERETAPK